MPEPHTINGLIQASVRRYPARPALALAFAPPLTYAALGESIRLLAAALVARGLACGDRVAILAENGPAWGVAYLAVTAARAIAVPILPDFPEADVHHTLHDSGVKFVFTSQRQIDKVLDFNRHALAGVFALDDSDPAHRDSAATFSGLLHEGASLPLSALRAVDAIDIAADDTAAIIYTSGTSGHAKAVMLSHANICANVRSAAAIIGFQPEPDGAPPRPEEGYCFLSILPLSHTYEFTLGFVLPLAHGGRVVYADRTPTPTVLEKLCQAARPDVICAVPMVMDKIYKKKVRPAIAASFWLRCLVRLPWPRQLVMQRIGANLRHFFGGNLKLMAIGGAALNIETETFLRQAGFPYIAGYGMTETAPLLAAGPLADPSVTLGSVGPPVPGVELRIADPEPRSGIGQIMARGPNIMQGYYQNPVLTAETIDPDGWLATGDLGYFDEVGNLHLTGRQKSVIVLSHGENIYPEAIEEKLNALPQVVDSLVRDNQDRLEALVTLDYDQIERESAGREEQRLYVPQLLAKIKATVNQGLPAYAKLHKVSERAEPFVKTATQKIKRYLYQ